LEHLRYKIYEKEAANGRHISQVTARDSLCQLFLPNIQDALTGCFYIHHRYFFYERLIF